MIQVKNDNWDDFQKEVDKLHKLEIKLQQQLFRSDNVGKEVDKLHKLEIKLLQQLLIPDNVVMNCGFETIHYENKKETIRRVSFCNEEKSNNFIIFQDGEVQFLLDDDEE